MAPAGEPGKCSLAGSAWEEKGNSLVDSSQYLPLVGAISVPIFIEEISSRSVLRLSWEGMELTFSCGQPDSREHALITRYTAFLEVSAELNKWVLWRAVCVESEGSVPNLLGSIPRFHLLPAA